ncbi:SH3 domain-containing protein [Aliiroseovarius sp. YM-037]|uniref:SH3 domain-containing protein n=1 Tax=Aliiroseovarius sp. YM-037 TaxID=3341728 RepID=UPI003A8100AC
MKIYGEDPAEQTPTTEANLAVEEPTPAVVEDPAPILASAVVSQPVHRAATRPRPVNLIQVGATDAPEGVILSRVTNWVVSGSRVNLRSGPSSRTAVVATLNQGTEAQVIAFEGNWARLSVNETGDEGYMSRRFLAPAR